MTEVTAATEKRQDLSMSFPVKGRTTDEVEVATRYMKVIFEREMPRE